MFAATIERLIFVPYALKHRGKGGGGGGGLVFYPLGAILRLAENIHDLKWNGATGSEGETRGVEIDETNLIDTFLFPSLFYK